MANLFYAVMEAEGDLLQPFEPTDEPAADMPDEQQGSQEQPPADMGADSPPDATDTEAIPGFDETGGGDDNGMGEDGQQDGEQPEKPSISKKANDLMNQQLYKQFLERNSEIEELMENLQAISPALPYEVTIQNESSMDRLKKALAFGQDYCLTKFINAQYGENLMQYQKLDVLYTLLQKRINSELKSFLKNSE